MLICREGTPERLITELATHELDLVISDAPPGVDVPVRVFRHLLGETGTTIFAIPSLATTYRRRFPESLHGAPFLLPGPQVVLRAQLDQWFEEQGIAPTVRGQFSDSALLKTFGQAGAGLFAGPTAIEREIRAQYGVQVVGRIPTVRERFYALSAERRLTHPSLVDLADIARQRIFR